MWVILGSARSSDSLRNSSGGSSDSLRNSRAGSSTENSLNGGNGACDLRNSRGRGSLRNSGSGGSRNSSNTVVRGNSVSATTIYGSDNGRSTRGTARSGRLGDFTGCCVLAVERGSQMMAAKTVIVVDSGSHELASRESSHTCRSSSGWSTVVRCSLSLASIKNVRVDHRSH